MVAAPGDLAEFVKPWLSGKRLAAGRRAGPGAGVPDDRDLLVNPI